MPSQNSRSHADNASGSANCHARREQDGRPAREPSTPGSSRRDPYVIDDDDNDAPLPQTPSRSRLSARAPRTPRASARVDPYPIRSPATLQLLKKGSFTGNVPVFVGWSKQQLQHLDTVPGRLDWAGTKNTDQRAAVIACLTCSGSVTFRMTLYNLQSLAMEEILGHAGRTISDTYRISNSNSAVVAYTNLVLASPFEGMMQGELRSELARLSLLPAGERFPETWYPTPRGWENN